MSRAEVKVCVIGVGRMGFLHARLLNRLGLLNSIIDSNLITAERVGKQLDVPWYTNLESMLQKHTPNGVIIAVPTKLHFNMAEQVVRKIPDLKALLIEKPVTPSSKEAEALRSILSSRNLAVIIGHIEVRGVQNFYPRMDEREWG